MNEINDENVIDDAKISEKKKKTKKDKFEVSDFQKKNQKNNKIIRYFKN